MKLYNKTLLQLQFKADLSQTGACASCHAAEFHGTKQYAHEAVAKHRAISKDIRHSLRQLIQQLDWYDAEVEKYHTKVVAMRLEVPDDLA